MNGQIMPLKRQLRRLAEALGSKKRFLNLKMVEE